MLDFHHFGWEWALGALGLGAAGSLCVIATGRYIARGVWFLPWVKGASVFAGHTLEEHPYKSAVLGAAGVQGRETQQAQLGDSPYPAPPRQP